MELQKHFEWFDIDKYLYTSTPDYTEYKFPKNMSIDLYSNRKQLLEKYKDVEITFTMECQYIKLYHKDKSQQFENARIRKEYNLK